MEFLAKNYTFQQVIAILVKKKFPQAFDKNSLAILVNLQGPQRLDSKHIVFLWNKILAASTKKKTNPNKKNFLH